MEWTSTESIFHFNDCSQVIEPLGYKLVELQIVPQKQIVKISAVISSSDSSKDIGVADCAKAHRALEAKLIALLGKNEDQVSMEVCSPGIERNLKNAYEFGLFAGRNVRVWDKEAGDWVHGKIDSADSTQVTLEFEDGSKKAVLFENIAKAKFIHL